jgi:hypothetical protein
VAVDDRHRRGQPEPPGQGERRGRQGQHQDAAEEAEDDLRVRAVRLLPE